MKYLFIMISLFFSVSASAEKDCSLDSQHGDILGKLISSAVCEATKPDNDPKRLEQIKQKVKQDAISRSDPNGACVKYGEYIYKNEPIEYSLDKCLTDARFFKHDFEVEEYNAEQARINSIDEQKQKEVDDLAAKQAEENNKKQQIIADLKSGKKKPVDFDETVISYGANRGGFLASAPKIKPDGALYGISGKIHLANEDDSFLAALDAGYIGETLLKAVRGYGNDVDKKFFEVRIPKNLKEKYYSTAQVGGAFNVIGRYIANNTYKLAMGGEISVPVFEAVYFQ